MSTISARFEPSILYFPNPERGFVGNAGDITRTNAELLEAEATAGFSLIRSYVRLDDFVERPLSQDFLAALDAGLNLLATSGLKVIIRFTYDPENAGPDEIGIDADIALAETHIQQLSPLFKQHQDVIAFVEAGFVGAYGEWHSSVSGLDKPANRLRIKNALMSGVPARQFILFRDPLDHQQWYAGDSRDSNALVSSEVPRAGFHNDCFLTGPTDGDTYPVRSPGLRKLVRQRSRFVPFGGETCQLPEPRSDCEAILTAGPEYSVSYLNWYFYRPAFHEIWQAQGCMGQIRKSLGYRFQLSAVSHRKQVVAGSGFDIALTLRNTGWARLYRDRPLIAHLLGPDEKSVLSAAVTGVDPTDWTPSTSSDERDLVSSGRVDTPANLPAGTYKLALSLPDPSPRLAANPRYSIRFANADQPDSDQFWDPLQARLLVGTKIRVIEREGAPQSRSSLRNN